jgi:predicted nucleotidyltransferase
MSEPIRASGSGSLPCEAVAGALRRALAARGDVRLGILFGSVARGRAREDSDVDVAVDAPGTDLLELAAELSVAVGREVHVVLLDQATYPLLCALVRDGVVVAEHPGGAAAEWRTRAILELETDRPWFERMRDAYLARLASGAP